MWDIQLQQAVEGASLGGGGGWRTSAPTRRPFTFCAACSIFNATQLTAAHAGPLVKNATHAAAAAWRVHALVLLGGRGTWRKVCVCGGGSGPYSACDRVWSYWRDQGGVCISPEGCVSAAAGRPLPEPPAADRPGWGLRGPRRGAAGFPCGCLQVGLTQQRLHYRDPC